MFRYACALLPLIAAPTVEAQKAPYDVYPDVAPPYYRVRYDASSEPGKLSLPVKYTVWIPENAKQLRGVVVHQHGCGEGSCKSGLTGAFDLHWQALAAKHSCALMAPSYEQPQQADCQLWCDPRNGSSDAFQRALRDLGQQSGHPELATVPWALWGHSGGGHWAGGMVMVHPERVIAAWLRSGVPLFESNPERPGIKPHVLPDAALSVPMMCNPGTKEGVTVKDGRFARVWPMNVAFFEKVRGQGGLVGVAVDPLTAHECGNQRYLAIPWLDACLAARLPSESGPELKAMATDDAWLAKPTGTKATRAADFDGDQKKAGWLPNAKIAEKWMEYVTDTKVADTSPPPKPHSINLTGNTLTWKASADPESGIQKFVIHRDGSFLANVPEKDTNRFGRPIFQGLQYSDTPLQPLVKMQFIDESSAEGKKHSYEVIAVNTVGLESEAASSGAAR